MKIFVSYSRRDSFSVQYIVKSLEELGIDVLVDSKNINVGDHFQLKIGDMIRTCHEFLIYVSPTSVNSHWVTYELGWADALEKRVIPITYAMDLKDLPNFISTRDVCDVNEIDRVYEQLRGRIDAASSTESGPERREGPSEDVRAEEAMRSSSPTPPPPPPPPPSSVPSRRGFSVGDRVRVTSRPQPTARRDLYDIDWSDDMDDYRDQPGTVTQVDPDGSVKLDIDNGDWWWAVEWLVPADGD